ncbi:response regulator [Pedobacter sp. HMF7647]|uniref:Response regulator n=1 Tax=Hufsiella arboris TaxID=2695275 RepID=A0A7K1Y9K3_9SPHI|nr:response regulator [Hufsiella arboris]MXV51100.1 response regulator [Hufsiella arboris]
MANRILIFDDDIDILSICSYILSEQGWEVFTSENCNDIVKRVRDIAPNVILMDNWIPDTGGIVATRALKNEADLKQIPVVYFSANNDIHTLAQQAGADTFLPKPFDIQELESKINSVLVHD